MTMMRSVRTLAGLAAALALFTMPALAQGRDTTTVKPWTVEDVLAMKAVSDVALSPDGKTVAYVVTTRDFEANVNRSDIWVVSAAGGKPVQLTNGPRANRAPQWAPDGTWLAFLSDRNDKKTAQVYGIDPAGGEAWPLTTHEKSVSSFVLSPNGQRIAFLATSPVSKADEDLEKRRGRPIVRDSAYANEWTRAWTVDITARKASEAKASSPEGFDVTSVVWGPDSRVLAWGARPTPALDSQGEGRVYVQSEPAAEARPLTRLEGGADVQAWADGLGVIVASSGRAHSTDNVRLWAVPFTGADPVALTDSLDESASYVAATPQALYVEAATGTGNALFRVALAAGHAVGSPKRLSDSTHYDSQFSASRDGSILAFVSEAATQPPNVAVSPAAGFAPTRLTNVNPRADSLAYGEQRVITWKSAADGESIQGILTLPVGYEKGKKVPLLLVIHGGPGGVSSTRYASMRGAYPVTVYSSMGYAVLQPNYRGSTGYGQRFRGLNHADIPGRDWVDVNSGVDEVIRMGIADSTRLGIMGWSYGGFQTYWGITHSTRFAAASAGAGANQLTAFYTQTDIPDYLYTLFGAAPWENQALYDAHSAYRLVSKVNVPLLIQVGDADRRVPMEQSIAFYEAVKGLGKVPVKLVIYPGQGHSVSDPRLSRDLMERNVEWFTHWIPVTGQRPPIRVEH